MQIIDTGKGAKRHHRLFATGGLPEVEQWIAATPRTWTESASTKTGTRFEWDFGIGYTGAANLARTGWSAGATDLAARLSIAPPLPAKEARYRLDVAGERPDVPRYVTGEPAHMIRRGKNTGAAPVIAILVGISASGSTDASNMKNYGSAQRLAR